MKKIGIFLILFLISHTFANTTPMPILAEHSGIYLCIKNGNIVSTKHFERYEKVCKLPFKYDDSDFFETFQVVKWEIDRNSFILVLHNKSKNNTFNLVIAYTGDALKLKKKRRGFPFAISLKDKLLTINNTLLKTHTSIKLSKSLLTILKKSGVLDRDGKSIRLEKILLYSPFYIVIPEKNPLFTSHQSFFVIDVKGKKCKNVELNTIHKISDIKFIPLNNKEYLIPIGERYDFPFISWGINTTVEYPTCITKFYDIYYLFADSHKIIKIPLERCNPLFILKPHCWVETQGFSYLKHIQKLSKSKIAFTFTGFDEQEKEQDFTVVFDLSDLKTVSQYYLNPFEVKKSVK